MVYDKNEMVSQGVNEGVSVYWSQIMPEETPNAAGNG